jgi:hypothetical protein
MKSAPDPTAYSLFPPVSSPIPRPRYLKNRDTTSTTPPSSATDNIDANTTNLIAPTTTSNSNPNPNPIRAQPHPPRTTLLKQPPHHLFRSDALGNGFIPNHPIYNSIAKHVYWHVLNPPAGLEETARAIIEGKEGERRRERRGLAGCQCDERDGKEGRRVERGEEGGNGDEEDANGENTVAEGVGGDERDGATGEQREGATGEQRAGASAREDETEFEGAQHRYLGAEVSQAKSDGRLSPKTQEGIARIRAIGAEMARRGSERRERQAASAARSDVEGVVPEFTLSLDGLGPEQSGGLGAGIDHMLNCEGTVSTDSLKLEARRFGLLGGHEIERRERSGSGSGSRASSVSAASRSRSREG